jgi:RHS repeat-associated protein
MSREQSGALRRLALADGLEQWLLEQGYRPQTTGAGGKVIGTDGGGRQLGFSLDQRGFIAGVGTPDRLWRFERNDAGGLEGMVLPGGARFGYRLDERQRIVEASLDGAVLGRPAYNAFGHLERIEYPDGTRERFAHRPDGKLWGVEDRLGGRTIYHRDDADRVTGVTDAEGRRATFRYAGGQAPPAAIVLPSGAAQLFQYDAAQRPIRLTQPDGSSAALSYPGAARLPDRIAWGDGEVLRFKRDGADRLVEIADGEDAWTFTYDGTGALLSEESAQGGRTAIRRDAGGMPIAMVWPDGAAAGLGWDRSGRLVEAVDWAGGRHRIEYLPNDCGEVWTAPGNLRTEVARGRLGQAETIATSRNGQTLFRFGAAHRATDGRIIEFSDSDLGDWRYVYDATGRVVEVERGRAGKLADAAGAERFAYDRSGRRVSANGQAVRCDADGGLVEQGALHIVRDARGFPVEAYDTAGCWRYRWSARGLLLSAEHSDGRQVTFGYDPCGRRLWKRSKAVETRYQWLGETLIGEVRRRPGRADEVRRYLMVPGRDTPLAMAVDGRIYVCHADGRGRVRRLTDELGRVVWAASWTAFGAAVIDQAEIDFDWRLPGQIFDAETGLHYNRFRYYCPRQGRYLTPDPISYAAGTDLYRYTENDPLNDADPMGLMSWGQIGAIAAGVVAAVAVTALCVVAAPLVGVAAGVALVAGILLGGAVGGALTAGIETGWCISCMLKGALIGFLAALPFAFAPLGAGIGLIMGLGALSGAIGYTADTVLNGTPWDWGDFAESVGLGAVLAGVFHGVLKSIAGKPGGPYSHLEDPENVGPGKDFTAAQKARIIQENMKKNGGIVKSDQSGQVLTRPAKSQKGVTPDPNEWQIDHIQPKDAGGTNSYSNAQVLSRAENREKWNN